jgi:hypothetical protein
MMDGMSMKENLTYNAKTDEFYGLPHNFSGNFVEKNDPLILANNALVLMMGGLKAKFEQVRPKNIYF